MKKFLIISTLIFAILGYGYHLIDASPTKVSNVCEIFDQKPHWFANAVSMEENWGTSIPVAMSIIYQESAFQQYAKPPFVFKFYIIPWGRQSSSHGFSQAVNGTWAMYEKEVGEANRTSFKDSIDFVGWFMHETNQRGIGVSDAYRQYLNYHEGWNGYKKGTHKAKPSLLKISRKVQQRAVKFETQLLECRADLESTISHHIISFLS